MAPSPFSSYKSEGNLTTEGLNFLKNTTQNTKWNCCSISLGSGNRENTKSTFIIKDQKYSCIKSTGITKQYVCLLETRYRQIVILQASWIQDHIYFFVGELLGNVYSSGWKHPLGVGEAHESHKENIWGKQSYIPWKPENSWTFLTPALNLYNSNSSIWEGKAGSVSSRPVRATCETLP